MAPIALLAMGLMAVAALLASCVRERPAIEQPLSLLNVPTIRVRLTSQPVDVAMLTSSGGYRLWVDGKAVSESAGPMPKTTIRRSNGRWNFNALSVQGQEATLEPLSGRLWVEAYSAEAAASAAKAEQTSYRGRLRLLAAGDQFTIVNHVDLESYLAGVLAKELYPHWSPVTYRALAIAARTFALYHMKTTGRDKDFDVGDDQASQVYGGASAETEKAWQAVRATHGKVLTFGPAGRERIFLAQYSACCGGVVNPASVLYNAPDIPPLAGGQGCDDCRHCPRYRWGPVRLGKDDIYRAAAQAYPTVANLGSLATLKLVGFTPHGRAVWVDLVGPNGRSVRLRAEDLRLALIRNAPNEGRQIYSMNCRIQDVGRSIEFADGKGFGHGVGLCQWGVQGKAELGWRTEEILLLYYPGSTILPAY